MKDLIKDDSVSEQDNYYNRKYLEFIEKHW